MIGEYRFFQEFFDGQIVKEESEKYKLFKIMLISVFLVVGLFFVFNGWCGIFPFLLLALGMIWNFYLKLDSRISFLLSIVVSFIYFYISCIYRVYANGLIYIALYIPFQLIANSKDYSEGDFVQIKKKITDLNKILFMVFCVLLFVVLFLVDYDFGARFILFDVFSATLLVCSALLRNERYFEYYIFRIVALISSIILWILVSVEYNSFETIVVVLMYSSYLIFDISQLIVQNKSYVNQYMLQVQMHEKQEDEKLVKVKLKEYEKINDGEIKNN